MINSFKLEWDKNGEPIFIRRTIREELIDDLYTTIKQTDKLDGKHS